MAVVGCEGVGAEVDRKRKEVAYSDRQLGDGGNARPVRQEAQGREGDDYHLGALRQKHVPRRKISPADIATFNAQYPHFAFCFDAEGNNTN